MKIFSDSLFVNKSLYRTVKASLLTSLERETSITFFNLFFYFLTTFFYYFSFLDLFFDVEFKFLLINLFNNVDIDFYD